MLLPRAAAILALTCLGCTGPVEHDVRQSVAAAPWCPRGFDPDTNLSDLLQAVHTAAAQGRLPQRTARLFDHIAFDDLAAYTAATAIPYTPAELELWTRNRVLPPREDFGLVQLPEQLRHVATFTAYVGVSTDSNLSYFESISETAFRQLLSTIDPIKTDGGITLSELLFAAAHLDRLPTEQRAAFELLIEYVSDPEQYGEVALRQTRVVFVPGPDALTPRVYTVFSSARVDSYELDPPCGAIEGRADELDPAALVSVLPVLANVNRRVALGASVLLRDELFASAAGCPRVDDIDVPSIDELQGAVTTVQASLDTFRDLHDHIADHDPMDDPQTLLARQRELEAHYLMPLGTEVDDLRHLVALREPGSPAEHDATVAALATRVRTDLSGLQNGSGACLGRGTATIRATTNQTDVTGHCPPSHDVSVDCTIETAGGGNLTCTVSYEIASYAGSPSNRCYTFDGSRTLTRPGQLHPRDRVVLSVEDAYDSQVRVQLGLLDRGTLALEQLYVRAGDHAVTFDGLATATVRWIGDADVTDGWRPVSHTGAPTARMGHAAVWTGDEMIIWGGTYWSHPTRRSDDGMRYAPATDTWRPMSKQHAPAGPFSHAVWTGTELLVWGGTAASSGRYDPATDRWSPMSVVGAPDLNDSVAVWTGSQLLLWGTGPEGVAGGRYDPALDAWTPMSTAQSPGERFGAVTVWTGTRMIVWGGTLSGPTWAPLATGASYDPVTDTWTPIPAAPRTGSGHAVWTGDEMIVWPVGLRFDPFASVWRDVRTAGRPPAEHRNIVWTGTEMLVWGGGLATTSPYHPGGRYDPRTDTWTPLLLPPTASMTDATPLDGQSLVWTGHEMIAWGGGYQYRLSTYTFQNGARFTY